MFRRDRKEEQSWATGLVYKYVAVIDIVIDRDFVT